MDNKLKNESSKGFYIQVTVVTIVIHILLYGLYYIDYTTTCFMKIHAYFGDAEAQFNIGQRHFLGKSVEKNRTLAFHWFRLAADQGHPHASFNLALGHLKGYFRMERGEAYKRIQEAATKGVKEATHVLKTYCVQRDCSVL